VVAAALAKIPGLDPLLVQDLYLGCAEPSGEQGANLPASWQYWPASTTSPRHVNRFCASSVQTTRIGLPRYQGREGDIFISAGVESVSRYTDSRGRWAKGETQNPKFAPTQARSAQMPPTTPSWTDPASRVCCPTSTVRMGQTAENVATSRWHLAARPGTNGASSAEPCQRRPSSMVLCPGDHPITTPEARLSSTE